MKRSAKCGPGGQWSLGSTLPRCQPVLCPVPSPPQHGSVHSQVPGQDQYLVGDIVKYHCDTGYMMSGSAITTITVPKDCINQQLHLVTIQY